MFLEINDIDIQQANNFMFLGKDQLTFGVVPLNDGCHSAQSAKSVMPLSIANCREKRSVLIFNF